MSEFEENAECEMTLEEMNAEVLECARFGEAEDLDTLLSAGADVNFQDSTGNTALHKASANGELECIKVLKKFEAEYKPNSNGNYPLHWAVQNRKLDTVKYLLESFDVDVLSKNVYGRSALTDAFESGDTDIIAACLSHSSSTEEKLLSTDDPTPDTTESVESKTATGEDKNAVNHTFSFGDNEIEEPDCDSAILVKIRELPITRADNPFGNEESPADDTTGLGVWPASLLLARYVVKMKDLFRDKVVVELGCGCGVPGITAGNPKKVYLTDIHEPTLKNLEHNISINSLSASDSVPSVVGMNVNWGDQSTYPSEKADVLIGSDLVYDSAILRMLVPAISGMMTEGGSFLYVAPDNARAGMSDLVSSLSEYKIHCIDCQPCPEDMFKNPLHSRDSDMFVLHFYDLSAGNPHSLFYFVKTDVYEGQCGTVAYAQPIMQYVYVTVKLKYCEDSKYRSESEDVLQCALT